LIEGIIMIRRYLAVAVIGGALALAPVAAFAAYPAPSAALNCLSTTVTVNTVFTCTIGGPNGANAVLTATTSGANPSIAGVVSLTKVIGAPEVATFTVTAPASALTIAFTGTVGGVPTNGASVVVTTGSGTLASTGAANINVAIGAGALLVLGGAALILGTHRKKKADA
jgi:LPXTG-motif cell wall-anchored protein